MIEDKISKKIENEVRNQVSAITDMPVYFMGVSASHESKGTTQTDEEDGETIDRRAVRIQLSNDDNGCEWAFNNDVSVSNNVQRLKNTFNNGFDVIISDDINTEDKKKVNEAKELIEKKIHELKIQEKTDSMIDNRTVYSFGILHKKIDEKNNDVIGLLELDCHEERCFPIHNTLIGDLGGDIGRGLDPDNKDMEVALIQKGQINTYTSEGTVSSSTTKNFYFSREEIISWTMNDRGKFKTISPVKRILRLVEIKRALENAVDLIVKRFGPQIWITVGNKDYNISNTRVPESYTRGTDGNPIDVSVARENYRKKIFDNIENSIQKWSDGENMVQLAEYGVEPKVFTPSANVFQYGKYIDQMSDYIKVGIFGLDVAGRVDVTSAVMQDRLFRDLKDRAIRERAILENIYQQELWNQILVANGYKENLVLVKFKKLDKIEFTEEAETERRRSLALLQYIKAGMPIPKRLIKKWEVEDVVLKDPDINNQNGGEDTPEPPGLKEQPSIKKEAEK